MRRARARSAAEAISRATESAIAPPANNPERYAPGLLLPDGLDRRLAAATCSGPAALPITRRRRAAVSGSLLRAPPICPLHLAKKTGEHCAPRFLGPTGINQRQVAGTCDGLAAVLVQAQVTGSSWVAWVGVRVRTGSCEAPVLVVVTVISPPAAMAMLAT